MEIGSPAGGVGIWHGMACCYSVHDVLHREVSSHNTYEQRRNTEERRPRIYSAYCLWSGRGRRRENRHTKANQPTKTPSHSEMVALLVALAQVYAVDSRSLNWIDPNRPKSKGSPTPLFPSRSDWCLEKEVRGSPVAKKMVQRRRRRRRTRQKWPLYAEKVSSSSSDAAVSLPPSLHYAYSGGRVLEIRMPSMPQARTRRRSLQSSLDLL